MLHFVTSYIKQNSHKQTLESAQYGLEISFKYLQLQTNKYLRQFLKSVIDSLICEYTDAMNILCQSSFKLLV